MLDDQGTYDYLEELRANQLEIQDMVLNVAAIAGSCHINMSINDVWESSEEIRRRILKIANDIKLAKKGNKNTVSL